MSDTMGRDWFLHIGRHGERRDFVEKWNADAPQWHAKDSPLSERGHEQARRMGRNLKEKNWLVNRVYVSPFIRTIETAFDAISSMILAMDANQTEKEWKVEFCVEYGIAEFHAGSAWSDDALPKSEAKPLIARLLADHAQGERLKHVIELRDDVEPIVSKRYFEELAASNRVEEYEEYMQRAERTMKGLLRRHASGEKSHILCIGHAAGSIACVRSLVNSSNYPVKCGVCSLSTMKICSRKGESADSHVKLVRNGDCTYLEEGEQFNWKFSHDQVLPFFEDNLTVRKVEPDDEYIRGIIKKCATYMSATFGLDHWMEGFNKDDDSNDKAPDQGVDCYLITASHNGTCLPVATFQCMDKDSEAVPQHLKEFQWPPTLNEKNLTVMYIRKLAVLPEFQQHGIGQWCMHQIHKNVVQKAEQAESPRAYVRLECSRKDKRVIEFFQKLDYAKLDTEPYASQFMSKCIAVNLIRPCACV